MFFFKVFIQWRVKVNEKNLKPKEEWGFNFLFLTIYCRDQQHHQLHQPPPKPQISQDFYRRIFNMEFNLASVCCTQIPVHDVRSCTLWSKSAPWRKKKSWKGRKRSTRLLQKLATTTNVATRHPQSKAWQGRKEFWAPRTSPAAKTPLTW